MGGYGSGVRTDKKRTVESCLFTLDIDELKVGFKYSFMPIRYEIKNYTNGTVNPFCSIMYKKDSAQHYFIDEKHNININGKVIVTFDNKQIYIAIETLETKEGNKLWWFLCPHCHKKAKKLYMPIYDYPIVCRKCHNLTYEKQQTHDRRYDDKNVEQTIINCIQNYNNSTTKEETSKNFFKLYFMATKLRTDLALKKNDKMQNGHNKKKE